MSRSSIAIASIVLCSHLARADRYVGGTGEVASDGAVSDSQSSNVNPATTVLSYALVDAEAGWRSRWLGIHGGFGFGRVGGDETTGSELELRAGIDARTGGGPVGLIGRFDLAAVDASYHFQSDTGFVALVAEPQAGLEVRFSNRWWVDALVGVRAKMIASSSDRYANPQWGWSLAIGAFCALD